MKTILIENIASKCESEKEGEREREKDDVIEFRTQI